MVSEYVEERNRARERIMRILSDGEWHTLADMTHGDCANYNVYNGVLHRLVMDGKVEHNKSAWIDGAGRHGYRLPGPRAPRARSAPAMPRGTTRAAIISLLSDGRWYTHTAIAYALPGYSRRAIEENTLRLRHEGILIACELTRSNHHGPRFAFALAEAVE